MTICPIALIVGCKKCPAFKVCPLKGVVGDYEEEDSPEPERDDKSAEKKSDIDEG